MASRFFLSLASLALLGQWLYLVVAQPKEIQLSSATWVSVAVLALFAAMWQRLSWRSLVIILIGALVNVGVGVFTDYYFWIPFYGDQLGGVIVAMLLGPTEGVAASCLGSLIWGTFFPHSLPYAAANALAPLMAGLDKKLGGSFQITMVIASAIFCGFITGILAVPIRFVAEDLPFGVELVVEALIGAFNWTGWASDPLDKVVIFVLAYLIVRKIRPLVVKNR